MVEPTGEAGRVETTLLPWLVSIRAAAAALLDHCSGGSRGRRVGIWPADGAILPPV